MPIFKSAKVFGLLLSLAMLTATSCGKYGSPLPPEDMRPAVVREFRIEGAAEGLKVTWLPPSTKVAGAPLDDLDGFSLARALVVDGKRRSYQVIARIRYETERGASGLGRRMVYTDRDVTPGLSYDYVLQAYNENGRSGPRSKITRVKFKGRSSDIEVLN